MCENDKISTAIMLPTLPCPAPLPEVVLFGFDDHAFPFQFHLQTHLAMAEGGDIVLAPGGKDSSDEYIAFYGTVIRIDDKFHIWYLGTGEERPVYVCYATSKDGLQWEKPNLGLVEFKGSRDNNIVDLPNLGLIAIAVLYDPEDSDPARRFKMVYEGKVDEWSYGMFVAFSEDGLRWRPSPKNPVGPFLEMAGITRFRGLYYVNGQDISGSVRGDPFRPLWSRRLVTYASADFEHWSPCGALGLDRANDSLFGPSAEDRPSDREEVHLGAAMWNRGNVILGIYGQWHGHFSGDRGLVTMDLGFAISHDGLHYREPIPGFRLIPARERPGRPNRGFTPALMQGQGMENFGDQTSYWYSLWGGASGHGVRLATWPRDRLGALKPFYPDRPRAISCPIVVQRGEARVYVNASGLGQHSQLRINLLDEGFRPLPGYSGESATIIRENGFHTALRWKAGEILTPGLGPVRLDVCFEGVRPEDCSLHAIYVGETQEAQR